MRFMGICLVAGAIGCAAQPFVPSNEQRTLFTEVVRQAEAAGAVDGSPEAARCLADAKSDFNYAQRIPQYPDRARQMAIQAQEEGAEALRLAQQHRREMAALAREGARVEAAADVTTTAAAEVTTTVAAEVTTAAAAEVTTTASAGDTTAPEATAEATTIPAAPETKTISPKLTTTESTTAAGEITARADN
jgi:hypothetical protein